MNPFAHYRHVSCTNFNNNWIKILIVGFLELWMATRGSPVTPPGSTSGYHSLSAPVTRRQVGRTSHTRQPLPTFQPSWTGARNRETPATGFQQFSTTVDSASRCPNLIRFADACFLYFFLRIQDRLRKQRGSKIQMLSSYDLVALMLSSATTYGSNFNCQPLKF